VRTTSSKLAETAGERRFLQEPEAMAESTAWLHSVLESATPADLVAVAICAAAPLLLARFLVGRRTEPLPRAFWIFTSFAVALATAVLVQVFLPLPGGDRCVGWLALATAVAALFATISLVATLPRALDLPRLQRANERLRRVLAERSRLAAIVADSRDAILATDLDGNVTFWNRAAERLFGWRQDEILGRSVSTLIGPREDGEAEHEALELTGTCGHDEDVEVTAILRDGTCVPVSMTRSPIHEPDSGTEAGASWILRDMRERVRTQQALRSIQATLQEKNARLRELVLRDPLTGLLNRRGVEEALLRAIGSAERDGSPQVAMLIDCDDFKSVNDRYGHEAGDAVLRQIAQRIQSATRSTDHAGRIGGDEFLVLLPDTRFAEGLQLAERIRLAVADLTFAVPGGEIECTVSIGVESVVDASSLTELVRRTGAALRRSKLAGKNLVSRHDVVHQGAIESLIEEDLEVWAQPIVAVDDASVHGFEMLIRGPEGPFRNPNDFFRVCREQDVLTRVDLACLRACLESARSLDRVASIHVNLFPSTIEHAAPGAIEAVLEGSGIDGRDVAIELNESMLVGDPANLQPRLDAIRRATGVRIAIDDVGFGRSSLEALLVLEPDVVKIDRRYVSGVGQDPVRRRHLARLLRVASSLGAEVVAEGVEDAADRAALVELGVPLAQGYLWSRPKPVRELTFELPRAIPPVAKTGTPDSQVVLGPRR
jgi:diguanylate cyclase (GGDEF)-like protein/PAS domain S-box-containing protein